MIDPFIRPTLVVDAELLDETIADLATLTDLSPVTLRTLPTVLLSHDFAQVRVDELLRGSSSTRLLLVGRLACRALRDNLRSPGLPDFAELRVGTVEAVLLPRPSDIPDDPGPRVELAQIIRREVRKIVVLERCATYIGSDGEGFWYNPVTGALDDDRGELGIGIPHYRAQDLMRLLCRVAGQIPRWAGDGLPVISVGAHSFEVAARAALIASQLGAPPEVGVLTAIEGVRHDLLELLPCIGDTPSPIVRLLRAFSPAWAKLERNADQAIGHLFGTHEHGEHAQLIARAVELADKDCAAIERALVFKDAPRWLGERGQQIALDLLARPAGEQLDLRGDLHRFSHDHTDALRFLAVGRSKDAERLLPWLRDPTCERGDWLADKLADRASVRALFPSIT